MSTPARNALNLKHLHNPEPGDYWHEMFCPVIVVIDVDLEKDAVYVIDARGKQSIDSDTDVILVDKEDFISVNSYKHRQDTTPSDVSPGKYKAMSEEWNQVGRPHVDRRKSVIMKTGIYKEIIHDHMWLVNDKNAIKHITRMDMVEDIVESSGGVYPVVLVRDSTVGYKAYPFSEFTDFVNKEMNTFKKDNDQSVWAK